MAEGESIPDLIARRRRELGYRNLKQLHDAYLAAGPDRGKYLSYEILRQHSRGSAGKLLDKTVTGLSLALDVHENEVRAAAGIPPTFGQWKPPKRADELDERQRNTVRRVIDELVRANRKAAGAGE